MFEYLGRKIDHAIEDLMIFNRKLFWYKIYIYFYCKGKDLWVLNWFYGSGQLYKWQYERLKRQIATKL